MAVKVIVELKAEPGRRDELKGVMRTLLAGLGPALKERGCLDSSYYEVVDDPDTLVEIADWETTDARDAVMSDPATAEAMAPVLAILAEPFKATVVHVD
ncbi:MAG TPA: antibiotic biosynthesis monooxygenase [Nocardioides sp.]|uniref:putative quinol monooxygenase n=1 Tax=uncultured Nocardioides sp. TaxID=198441 RepID=UPI0026399C5A|nr:antibiotic biosynthesis monooxygenase [uncultured Nocardioides sp.]HRD59748.1 antibiotic biosynthesis monooxygenase [Nocardioides sp.]HRI97939.1 antibiotic biosynthesis monooxygenase [Nocardioides sp.]HRK46548.1 antibiotic biosynthesis monooxygenase [Nocardioides sp.]